MKLGQIELISILENSFFLDGGSMFGVIPRVIWGKMVHYDENNMIRLDINPLLIKTPDQNIIVDTGFGDILNEKQKKIYPLAGPTKWDEQLAKNGLKPKDITAIILSHAHADHAMGALRLCSDGKPELRFPNAEIYIQKREWQDAMNPNERTAGTYFADNLRILEESGKLELIEGDVELFKNISVKVMGGHTSGSQAILIDGAGQRVIYPADIMPMTAHIRVPYVAAVDLDPTTTMERKRWLHEHMLKDDWILAFDHDIDIKFARFTSDEKGRAKAVKVE